MPDDEDDDEVAISRSMPRSQPTHSADADEDDEDFDNAENVEDVEEIFVRDTSSTTRDITQMLS